MSDKVTPKTWGTYEWDASKTHSQNIEAARAANALITTSDLQRYENQFESFSEQLAQLKASLDELTQAFEYYTLDTATTPEEDNYLEGV